MHKSLALKQLDSKKKMIMQHCQFQKHTYKDLVKKMDMALEYNANRMNIMIEYAKMLKMLGNILKSQGLIL